MYKKNVFVALPLIVAASGCSSVVGESVNQNVSFNGEQERHFVFSKNGGNISKADIYSALHSAIKNESIVRDVYHRNSRSRGMGASISEELITVIHYDNYEGLVDEKVANYNVMIDEERDNYKVTLKCPSMYHDIATFRVSISKEYLSGDTVVKNLNHICKNINPIIKKSDWVKDEFNAKFKSEDVFANYSRILTKVSHKEDVKGFDIEKAEIFKLPMTDNENTNLALSVFPYRGGSKVVYAFSYAYEANSQGSTTYNKDVLEKTKKSILDIAND